MDQKKIQIHNGFFHTLTGIIQKPAGEGPFPIAIICHGLAGNHEQDIYNNISNELTSNGIIALRFDFSVKIEKDIWLSHIRSQLHDLNKVVDYAQQIPFIDKSKISLIGHSLGGTVSLLYAAHDKRIKKVCALSARVFLGEGFDNHPWSREAQEKGFFTIQRSNKQEFKIHKKFLEENFTHNEKVKEAIEKLKIPVLVIYGTANTDDVENSTFLAQKLAHATIKPLPDADHAYRTPSGAQQKMAKIVYSWIK